MPQNTYNVVNRVMIEASVQELPYLVVYGLCSLVNGFNTVYL